MELNRLFDFLDKIYEKADVGAAFGEPETVGGRTIIPVARVSYGLGLGFGEGQPPDHDDEEDDVAGAGAGGGGGGGMAVPIGVIEVTDEETRVISITDATKVALAGILLVAWNVFWIARTIRVFKGRGPRV